MIEQYLLEGRVYKMAVKMRDGAVKCRANAGLVLPVWAVFEAGVHLDTFGRIVNG